MSLKTFKLQSIPNWIMLSIIGVLFLFVFKQLFYANFISWDDPEYITANKDVVEFNVKNLLTGYYIGNFHPITMINYGIDYLIFKSNPKWYHIENLIWHFLNVYVLIILCKKLKLQLLQLSIIVVVFAFHPLQLESIAWVAERKNLLYSFFFLLALVQFFNYREKNQIKYLIITYLFFILSILSKPSAVVFPIIIILLDFFIFKKSIKSIITVSIGLFIISFIIGFITLDAQKEAHFLLNTHSNYTVINKIGIFGYGLMHYLSKFIFPIGLSAFYSYPDDVSSLLIVGIISIIVFILLIVFLIIKKHNIPLLWLLFFLVNIALVLQVISFGDAIAADRYMYLPMIGLILFLVNLFPKISNHYVTILLISMPLIVITMNRSNLWKNSLPLFLNVLESNPNSFIANNSLGVEYMDKNDTVNALKYLNKTILLYPKSYKAFYNRGLYFGKYNYFDKAIVDLSKSIELSGYYKAYIARANAHYFLKNYSLSITDAQEVLKYDNQNFKAFVILASAYDESNQLDEALNYYNKAIFINENEPMIFLRRGILFGKLQQFDRCYYDIDKCISINPKYAEAYYWRGVAKVNLNQNPCNDFKDAANLGFNRALNALQKFCK